MIIRVITLVIAVSALSLTSRTATASIIQYAFDGVFTTFVGAPLSSQSYSGTFAVDTSLIGGSGSGTVGPVGSNYIPALRSLTATANGTTFDMSDDLNFPLNPRVTFLNGSPLGLVFNLINGDEKFEVAGNDANYLKTGVSLASAPAGSTTISVSDNQDPAPIVLLDPDVGLDEWETTGNGTAQIIQNQDKGAVVQIGVTDETAVGSAVIFSTQIDTPEDPFFLSFDYLFETTTGSLEVSLNDVLLATLAPSISTDFLSFSELITLNSLLGLTNTELSFSLFPGSPSSILLDDVSLSLADSASVPAPATLALFGLGFAGLVLSRRKKA